MARGELRQDLGRSWWTVVLSLCGLCLVVRVGGLMRLPIFGDEAIYLRWAELVGGGHWWVSLCDPKPPLHFWILAGVLEWMRGDPLRAGRVVSVLAGVLSVPAVMLACGELGRLFRGEEGTGPSGRVVGILAALLMIFCPFLAFYQRLATADAGFVLEMLVAVWISLRWGRLAGQGESCWKAAVVMGVVMGAAMLTRQGLSYLLWGMPLVAVNLHRLGRGKLERMEMEKSERGRGWLGRRVGTLLLAVVVAGVLWSPFLLARLGEMAAENGGVGAELHRRIFYQSGFAGGGAERMQMVGRNFGLAFVPATEKGEPVSGWLFYYLTPGVYVVSVLGLGLLALRRQWWVLGFLLMWLAFMLIAPLMMLDTIYSRYVLAGVVPLLIAAAYAVAECLGWLVSRRGPGVLRWGAAAAVLGGLLAGPVVEIGVQSGRWEKQVFVGKDRYQYMTGWTAGGATQDAIAALRELAREGPVTVITDEGWGNPADAVWVYLSREKNVRLYYTVHGNDGVILMPAVGAGTANTFMLRKDKFLFTPPEPVQLSPQGQIFYVSSDPVHEGGRAVPAEAYFKEKNPNLGAGISFEGVGGGERVMVFPVVVSLGE